MKRKNRIHKLLVSSLSGLLILMVTLSACQMSTSEIPEEDISTKVNSNFTINDDIADDVTETSPELALGATKVREKDGMEMVFVPEGSFSMGSDDGESNEKPIREVYLDAYWIDKYEVSNGQYALCVAAGACTKPNDDSSRTRDNYYGNPEYDHFPVGYVDWYQANAYCEWVGGRLPSEAEWEKAARGPNGNKYPWGNEDASCGLSNYNQGSYDKPDFCVGDTSQVGSYPNGTSYYGVMDMAGNVWEWVNDWYGPYDATDTINPTGPNGEQDYKVIRGNSWYNIDKDIRSAYRGRMKPSSGQNSNFGFRCAFPQP